MKLNQFFALYLFATYTTCQDDLRYILLYSLFAHDLQEAKITSGIYFCIYCLHMTYIKAKTTSRIYFLCLLLAHDLYKSKENIRFILLCLLFVHGLQEAKITSCIYFCVYCLHMTYLKQRQPHVYTFLFIVCTLPTRSKGNLRYILLYLLLAHDLNKSKDNLTYIPYFYWLYTTYKIQR